MHPINVQLLTFAMLKNTFVNNQIEKPMKSFNWGENFLTGINEVDDQHHHLVELINQFGALLAQNDVKIEDIDTLYNKLVDYSQYHFHEEEQMMEDLQIDEAYRQKHILIHRGFLNDLQTIYSTLSSDNLEQANSLLKFLTNWLAYHILGQDKVLAKQVQAIKAGATGKQAYLHATQQKHDSTEPLVEALDSLFNLVSLRNKELKELNESLEEKVKQRTKELSEANKRLQVMSLTDSLTGLPNRRHAMDFLDEQWQKSLINGTDLACIMIDADYFKQVNDSYGHDAGDKVLQEVAKTLLYGFRNDDLVCRLGGDEFLVICPNTGLTDALDLAETTRLNINQLQVETSGYPWLGSVSLGVACRDINMVEYEALIKMADDGVYAAKQSGKNCVRCAKELST